MNLKNVRSGALLGLSALLLAACGPQNGIVTPNPDALTQPPALTVGKATELQNVPAVLERASGTLASMLNPASPDFDPDLKVLFQLMGVRGSSVPNASTNPLGLGHDLTRMLTRQGTIRPLDSSATPVTQQNPLPTGTYTLDAAGNVSSSKEPTTGYVMRNLAEGTTFAVNWREGGAATVWVEYTQAGPYMVRIRQELPTRASATFTKEGRKLAAAGFSLTPGACLGTAGPEALSLNAWAGREQNPPASLGLQYGWTDTGISLKANASYRTRTYSAGAALDLDIRGTTANRCTPASLSFTPTRADFGASASVPGDAVEASLGLRKLNNLVISGAELKTPSPFARVTGDLSASVTHNAQPMLTAFGPLADGADMDLLPGDAVVVRYVQNGKLVETNLAGALKKFFR
ncbi:hypothetical protein DAERI_120118 [Deinococcus aerius]|uniref:Lipoprotein n=1 Tax=Deinococcus aerius TaxID=200253 RepID=A0A2I9E0S5_9DEIO|nr:hypothetical protein [Deinococcus aerius]GBF07125.1 hypothetical protein DAERI_120118 [Deinococcus aerius]